MLSTGGKQVLATSRSVRDEPGRAFVTGLTGILALFLTALLLTALWAAFVGLPMLALVAFFALLLKLWGLVAVFHAFGEAIGRWVLRRRLLPLNAACVGLVALGAIKLLPWSAPSPGGPRPGRRRRHPAHQVRPPQALAPAGSGGGRA
ncbi:MAG: hypothetical protein R2991_13170 [Thermoanaerobaculia bacterium]